MSLNLDESYFLSNHERVTTQAFFSDGDNLMAAVKDYRGNFKIVNSDCLSKHRYNTVTKTIVVQIAEDGSIGGQVYHRNQQVPPGGETTATSLYQKKELVNEI